MTPEGEPAQGEPAPRELAPLRELAALHGIQAHWQDVFERAHAVPERTLRALLAAMGVAARDEAEVTASLAQARQRLWTEVLPPVCVVRDPEQPARVALRLPAGDHRSLELHVRQENGTDLRHSVRPEGLERSEQALVGAARFEAWRLPLPRVPRGYHRISLLRGNEPLAELSLIVVPERCYQPRALERARVWGPALQLYAARSQRNWGIGDFTDLARVLASWRSRGADLVGVNPLHALFTHAPERASPYSPSDRLFLNVLYLDPERIEDFTECEGARELTRSAQFQAQLAELRASELVRYAQVAEVKLAVLEQLYASFRHRHLQPGSPRGREFREFVRRGGEPLERHARYEALQERFARSDPRIWGWPAWPEEYRACDSPAVEEFARSARERIELYQYLQWQAQLQLAAVNEQARSLGAIVGLYGDLAVSMDRGGAESWSNQVCLALAADVGAPPDEFNPAGQNWGLPPFVPARLRAAAYAPFVALLRANMRQLRALRIDHVMGLERLYWVPSGASPTEGAYVSYPLEDLLGILALESERAACLVVGEDLGTVSARLRTELERFGLLSYRILYFEREADGAFKPPGSYPALALAAATTHDLATLAGFWEGRDIAVRGALGLYPSDEIRRQQIVERSQMRAQLLLALDREQLLPEGMGLDPVGVPAMTPALARAIQAWLARSPARLLAVQLEDVTLAADQVNLPGTTAERYPNWRRKLTEDIETLVLDERAVRLADALRRERPQPEQPAPALRERAAASVKAVIPRATYRLQLNASFGLRAATALVPYLARLGVSHVYCSPYFRARPGSMHGYDVVDHNSLNPEIGDREDLERFIAALRAHSMGHILDIVPNHVGIMGADNAWWMDVLENGQASVYAPFFDIDWQPVNPALAGKVLVPVLGEQYGAVLERGELALRFEPGAGGFAVFYHEHRFPLDPRDYSPLIERSLLLARRDALTEEERAEAQSLAAAFGHLPGREAPTPARIEERNRDKEVHKRRLAALCARNEALAEAVAAAVRALNGKPADPASFDELDQLLGRQAYRLAYWRVAADEINYRRFFDVNDLAALRMENEAVFEATHRLALELVHSGQLDGLRIDHPDGLYDPAGYCRRLQLRAAGGAAAGAQGQELPLYLVVEKITAGFERLPQDWAVHGTTGYRFANVLSGLAIDQTARRRFDRLYRSFIGEPLQWESVAYESKRLIVSSSLAAELNVLANALAHIAGSLRTTRDFTLNNLRQALTEVIACFPVYRTYAAESLSAQDRRYIEWAVNAARRRAPAVDAAVYDFVRAILLGEGPGADPHLAAAARAFTMKFQQVTAPVTAKGVEDTACYRFNRLVALNEVGGEPDTFGTPVRAFHADALYRRTHWPHELLASSTHDTKRSEDVRARIAVLSEMPGEWRRMLERWSRMNRRHRRLTEGARAPSANDEYLLYQTLLGTLPLDARADAPLGDFPERIDAYMRKAAREAKLRTSWSSVDPAYEEALAAFCRAILEPGPFLADLIAVSARLARFGLLNSLSQTLLKLTAPGVPDVYQGTEVWDFSLVDPDNRRPVDYDARRRALHGLEGLDESQQERGRAAAALLSQLSDGRAKLYVICRALALRRAHAALFRDGEYVALATAGRAAGHLCAFARLNGDTLAVTVVPRLMLRLLADRPAEWPLGAEVWGDTRVQLPRRLAPGILTNVYDGADVSVREFAGKHVLPAAELFARFPVALLAGTLRRKESP